MNRVHSFAFGLLVSVIYVVPVASMGQEAAPGSRRGGFAARGRAQVRGHHDWGGFFIFGAKGEAAHGRPAS